MQTDNCINTASYSAVCNDVTAADVTSSLVLALCGIALIIYVLRKAGVTFGDMFAWVFFIVVLALGAAALFSGG